MVLEQHPIAATPRYNFPQSAMNATFPREFMELSLHSLSSEQFHPFQLNQQDSQQANTLEEDAQSITIRLKPIQLKPRRTEDVVAAVDTSTIRLGETGTGILIAIRGANVWKQDTKYRYARLGPFIFHITENNKKDLCKALETVCLGRSLSLNHQASPGLLQMQTKMASLLERWLQSILCRTVNNGIILFDGSLGAGTPDSPTWFVKHMLESARENGCAVLAFSKMTSLRANGYLITDFASEHMPPYLLETLRTAPNLPIVLLGDVYVARLTRGGYAFRLDVDKELTLKEKIDAVERLAGNDSLCQSYPETLRLAHILCTFTANEVLAMQHFVASKCRLQMISRPDMHRLLFGPFGRGENCA